MGKWTQVGLALVSGLIASTPAGAQDVPIVQDPAAINGVASPAMTPVPPPPPTPPPVRPGLFGWRARHAARKQRIQDRWLGYPEEFREWPLGWSLYSHGRTMVADGQDARMILNHYDFVGETAELNARGIDKLHWIAEQIPATFAPVIIERTPATPGVDQRRRLAVLGKLAQGPVPAPAERVIVGPATMPGLRGRDSVVVDSARLNRYPRGGSGSIAGGFDGSGLSGSAAAAGVSGGTLPNDR